MNIIKFSAFYIFSFCFIFNKSFAQEDSCKQLIYPNNYDYVTNSGYFNPDSVLIDNCLNSVTYGKIFAKRYFQIKFNLYPFDSVITNNEIKMVADLRDDIPLLTEKFLELEQEFGTVYFIRDYNQNNYPDSIYSKSGYVDFYFDDYQNIELVIDSVKSKLSSLVLIINYSGRAGDPLLVPSDIALSQGTKISEIYRNWKQDRQYWAHSWNDDYYPPNFSPLGYQTYIYEVNCPMAWEISMGEPNTVIDIEGDN